MSSNSITNESDTFEIGGSTVRRLGFGAMRITGEDIIGAPEDEESAREVVRQAVDCGVDLIDTADSYGPAVSERLIGEAIGDPDDVLIATKAGLLRNSEGEWLAHGDPDYIRNQSSRPSTGSGRTRSISISSIGRTTTRPSRTPSRPSRNSKTRLRRRGRRQ